MSWNECRPIMYERMSLVTGTAQQYRHNTAQVLRMFPVACWMQTLHVAYYVTASYIIFTPTTPAVFKHGPWTPGVVDRLPVGHWHTTWGSTGYLGVVDGLPGGRWQATWGLLTSYLGGHWRATWGSMDNEKMFKNQKLNPTSDCQYPQHSFNHSS